MVPRRPPVGRLRRARLLQRQHRRRGHASADLHEEPRDRRDPPGHLLGHRRQRSPQHRGARRCARVPVDGIARRLSEPGRRDAGVHVPAQHRHHPSRCRRACRPSTRSASARAATRSLPRPARARLRVHRRSPGRRPRHRHRPDLLRQVRPPARGRERSAPGHQRQRPEHQSLPSATPRRRRVR